MKLSNKQAELLAKQVVEKLAAKNVFKIPAAKRLEIKKYTDKRNALVKKREQINAEINIHEATLKNIVGKVGAYTYDSFQKIIDKMENANVPSLSQITDEIILSAMFANQNDMESFISKIVEKFSKNII